MSPGRRTASPMSLFQEATTRCCSTNTKPSSPNRTQNQVNANTPTSKDLPNLDGSYLSIVNGSVGIFPQPSPGGNPLYHALQWYPSQNASRTLYEMHVYPEGEVDHALGLMGTVGTGLFEFLDFQDPANMIVPAIYTVSWQDWMLNSFPPKIDADEVECVSADEPVPVEPIPDVERGQTLTIGGAVAGEKGRWQAFPRSEGAWALYWNDGTAITTADYMPVEVVWEVGSIICEKAEKI